MRSDRKDLLPGGGEPVVPDVLQDNDDGNGGDVAHDATMTSAGATPPNPVFHASA